MGKAWLSNKVFRIVSKTLVVGCVVQVIVIQVIYMSNESASHGMAISWPNIFWVFIGNLISIPLISFVLIVFIEQPLLKVIHLLILPYISHDYMLMNFYDIKNGITDSSHVQETD